MLQIWPSLEASVCWGHSVLQTLALLIPSPDGINRLFCVISSPEVKFHFHHFSISVMPFFVLHISDGIYLAVLEKLCSVLY